MAHEILKGTLDICLCYNQMCTNHEIVKGCVDSNYARCLHSRKSISGYVFTLFGGVVSWRASLQKVVSLSSTKAENIAATEAIKEAIKLKEMLSECTGVDQEVNVYWYNQSAIDLVRNPKFDEMSEHVDIKLHFIRDVVETGQVTFDKNGIEENPSHALTEVLPVSKFKFFMATIQVWDAGGGLIRDNE